MASAKKLILPHHYNFSLTGISCHEKLYRLCWALNNTLGLTLKKDLDITLFDKKTNSTLMFPAFSFQDESTLISYRIISNKYKNKVLVAEHKQADYLFMIQGELLTADRNNLEKKIKQVSFIQTIFGISIEKIKSKDLFIF
jgi:hypothetical protein